MIKQILLTCLFVFLWLSHPVVLTALDPHTAMEKYIHHQWTTRDGLPQNTIHAIVQDRQGFIWLGTDGGMVRFDGTTFKTYNQENTPELANNAIVSLALSRDGALWISTYGGGITFLKNNQFQQYRPKNRLPSLFIKTIFATHTTSPLFGTTGAGLFRPAKGAYALLNKSRGLSSDEVLVLCLDSQSKIWIGTASGLNCLEKGKIVTYAPIEHFRGQKITALYEDSRGFLWVGTERGAFRFHSRLLGVSWVPGDANDGERVVDGYTTALGLAGNEIRAIVEDRHRNIWVATQRGLSRLTFDPRPGTAPQRPRIANFSDTEGLGDNALLSLFQDGQGNLWVGSAAGGLHVLREGKFSFYTEKDGLSNSYIKTIFQDHQDTLWIGTHGGGLNRQQPQARELDSGAPRATEFITYTQQDGLSSDQVESITEDKGGNLWVGTTDGLNRFKEGVFQVYTTAEGLSHNAITCLSAAADDGLWIGTFGGGLNVYQGGVFRSYTTGDGLPDNVVLALTRDGYGNLWIGTNQGVTSFDGQLFRHFAGQGQVPTGMVLDIYNDADGALWMATHAEGLIRYQKGVFTRFDLGKPFASGAIFRILEDDHENFWFSSATGIFTLSRRRLNAYARQHPAPIIRAGAEGNQAFIKGQYFQEDDGLITAVCSGGSQPAGWKAKDGTLYFPTIKGMAVMDLSKTIFSVAANPADTPQTPPQGQVGVSYVTIIQEEPVFIETILVDGAPLAKQNHFTLPASTRSLEFQFIAINYRTPGKTLYKYRLTGYEANWQVSRESRVVYNHIPAGDYEFKVYARHSDGNWSYEGDSYAFSIADSFFRSLWFYFLVVIGLVVVMVVVQHGLKNNEPMETLPEEKYKGSTLTPQKSKSLLKELLNVMATEQPYLDPELSLQKLAQRIGITKEDLSQVINEQMNVNFKNFLNTFRIEEAKKRLVDPRENQFVLLKIAFDVGFNSKSAFNASFKKITGLSPSDYRKQNQK